MEKIVTVLDSKAEAYLKPLFFKSKGEAIRMFENEVNGNHDTMLSKHPEDFTLYEIGEWDERSGKLTILEAKIAIGNGMDFKKNGTKLSISNS